jgi:hypothetical protein
MDWRICASHGEYLGASPDDLAQAGCGKGLAVAQDTPISLERASATFVARLSPESHTMS